MFVKAIDIASNFTRPIYTISRNYLSTEVIPGAATLFFINSNGWAFTCGHVVDDLYLVDKINTDYHSFKTELATKSETIKSTNLLQNLEKKYRYNKQVTIELQCRFLNCVEGELKISLIKNKKYDVALIKFLDFPKLLCYSFPCFPKDTSKLKPGKFLCRLGFPFPEFTNFEYDEDSDSIRWTETGNMNSPQFPSEGMLTRMNIDAEDQVFAFEMSTPGLLGQSGGPVIDSEGKIWGMQFATSHLDLNFDVDQEVIRKGVKKHIQDSAFLHVGHCIHVDILKSFMVENGVVFREE